MRAPEPSAESLAAADPRTPPARLLALVERFPVEVLQNPALPLIALEDPERFETLRYRASRLAVAQTLWRQAEQAPPAAVPLHPRQLRPWLLAHFPGCVASLAARLPLALDPEITGDPESAVSQVAYEFHLSRCRRVLREVPAPRCFQLGARFVRRALEAAPPFLGRRGLFALLDEVDRAGQGQLSAPRPAFLHRAARLSLNARVRQHLAAKRARETPSWRSPLVSATRASLFAGELPEVSAKAAAAVASLKSEDALARGVSIDWSRHWDELHDDETAWHLAQALAPPG